MEQDGVDLHDVAVGRDLRQRLRHRADGALGAEPLRLDRLRGLLRVDRGQLRLLAYQVLEQVLPHAALPQA